MAYHYAVDDTDQAQNAERYGEIKKARYNGSKPWIAFEQACIDEKRIHDLGKLASGENHQR
jgi:hypothetical protein